MRSGLCHTRLNTLDSFHDNDLGNLGWSPQNALDSKHFSNFLWCLCGSCREWKHFYCTERNYQMALEIRHRNIAFKKWCANNIMKIQMEERLFFQQ
jgi:fructosamine-3-kinase